MQHTLTLRSSLLHFAACIYRPESKPLLTVSNHCSTLDDPTLFATLVPWSVDLRPKQMRWTICSEELCFMNAFTR
jgi:monolysocardiolipin acyltransferase